MQERYGLSTGNHIVVSASSDLDINSLTRKLSRSAGSGTVQIFDPDCVASERQLSAAYLNSVVSFKDKTNISNSKSMEMLLFVALTKKIDEAIDKAGAKTNKRFVLFCDSKKTYGSASKFISSSSKFNATKKRHDQILSKMGIKSGDDARLLEMMAMTRLND